MLRVLVESDYKIAIPEPLRSPLAVGDELLITTDASGRIIITSHARVRSILQRTAGLWRGRADLPDDGIAYVNQLRQGRRLRELGVIADGD